MRKNLPALLAWLCCLFSICAQAQVTIGSIDNGPYGRGSTIGVPLSIPSNIATFAPDNIFTLFISGPGGDFAQESQIGTYRGFYSTFINGVLPADIAAGSYKLKVKSSSPASEAISAQSVQVLAVSGPKVGVTPAANLILGDDVYGWCGSAVGPSKSITLGDNSAAPTIQQVSLKNELTGTTQTYGKSAVGYNLSNLPEGYYTITVTGEISIGNDKIKSSKSYLLLNIRSVAALSSTSDGCLDPSAGTGADVVIQADAQTANAIRNNYPGTGYRITWGDGTTNIYTHGDLIARSGVLTHKYLKSSCGEPQVDLGNGNKIDNAFKITITAGNSFCQTETGSATTYTKIFTKPIAKIDGPKSLTACLDVPVVFGNSSAKGNNSDCTINMIYEWYVDGKPEPVSIAETLTYTFKTPGPHTVKLVARNNVGICQPSEDFIEICVQEKPVPAFNFNGQPGATICLGSTLKATNTSKIDQYCNKDTYLWTVTGGTAGYANGTSNTSKDPEFTFSTAGIYKVKLTIKTASCAEVSTKEQTVVVNGPPVTKLSPDLELCNLTTYNFDNTTSGPTRTTHTGTMADLADTYTWTVTGGTYSYADGTTANSKYPHITFNEYKAYTVTVTHQNTCGKSTASQKLNFIPSPVVDAGTDQTICFEQNVQLNGNITGNVMSSRWVGGLGTFTPSRDAWNAVYTPTDAERRSGSVQLTFQANTTLAAPCKVIADFTTIKINPQININSPATAARCNNVALNYGITSNIPGADFTWTATGSANATGFQTTGSGATINDVIRNTQPATDAIVTYVITPMANGCTGAPFTLTVTIADIKNTISSSTSVVCNSQDIIVAGNSPTGGNNVYNYVWESSTNDGATWTRVPGQTNENLSIKLTETLSFRRIVFSGECSTISSTVKVSALPPLTNNTITNDQTICTGRIPGVLTGSMPTGGDGQYNYQWESSVDNGATWTNVDNAISKDFKPPALTVTTLFRRRVGTITCTGSLQNVSSAVTITVNENAKAEFTFTSDRSCAPFAIDGQNIKATAYPDRNSTYTWYADNVVIGTGIQFPGYTIAADNKAVEIRLVAASSFGCSEDIQKQIFLTQPRATASFTQDVKESCGTAEVNFKNTTLRLNGSTYAWDFGNGNKANTVEPTRQTYPAAPSGRDTTYTVTLTVTSNCGITTYTSTVLVKAKPLSVFSPSKTIGCSPMVVNFSNTSPGDANTYYYDFGDGTPPLKTNSKTGVTHTYTTGVAQNYTVTMVTENSCGKSEPTEYTIRVSPNTILPELVVNSTELEGCAPWTVKFQNNTSGATSFIYDFGDGSTYGPTRSAPENVTHTFTKGGIYIVKLTASNGCSDTTTTERIVVYNQPQVKFSSNVTTGCAGLEVKFKNESTDAVSYTWDFGDGSAPSNEAAPVHIYDGKQEYYTVKLTAVNSLGCENTISLSQFVHIIPAPVARFNVLPSAQISIPNYTFQFEDESEGSADRWEWDFGDGSTSSSRSPNHTYADTGSYKVTLRVTNQQSCFTTLTKEVKIIGVPGYLFVPNAFMPESATPELREFKAKGSGIESWTMSIFNKWGELIWQTTKLEEGAPAEGWNGTYKSSLVPQGVYFWKIDVQMINKIPWKGMSYNGSAPKRTGVINLIR
jgi:PKD repeat protein